MWFQTSSKLDIKASWTNSRKFPFNFEVSWRYRRNACQSSKKLSEIETDFPVEIKTFRNLWVPEYQKSKDFLWCGIKDDISKLTFPEDSGISVKDLI
ncbi:MAG: hypothetical protein R2883_06080 [Caldisericia bacterium]